MHMDPIDKLDPTTVSYIDFFCDYLLPNKPCIFTSDITDRWRSRQEWVGKNVPVVDSRQISGYDTQNQECMRLKDFICNHFDDPDSGLYLKDWHFVKHVPSYQAYKVPIYFQNDWMNEYWDTKSDLVEIDYRFVYIGGKDTWTPFHADVFRSHSWSANICGRKKWFIVQPGVENRLQQYWKEQLPDSKLVTAVNDIRPVLNKHCELTMDNAVMEIIQEPGELIFVPSNWHHQVHNLEPVISINHNWCNGANIHLLWRYVSDRLVEVKKELSDSRDFMRYEDWIAQCQLVLKCDVGMDFQELLSMISLITENRLQRLRDQKTILLNKSLFKCHSCGSELSKCQRTSDCLIALKSVLKNRCTCTIRSEHCDFCLQFFDAYDIHAGLECMQNVLDTNDASILRNFHDTWVVLRSNICSSFASFIDEK